LRGDPLRLHQRPFVRMQVRRCKRSENEDEASDGCTHGKPPYPIPWTPGC